MAPYLQLDKRDRKMAVRDTLTSAKSHSKSSYRDTKWSLVEQTLGASKQSEKAADTNPGMPLNLDQVVFAPT